MASPVCICSRTGRKGGPRSPLGAARMAGQPLESIKAPAPYAMMKGCFLGLQAGAVWMAVEGLVWSLRFLVCSFLCRMCIQQHSSFPHRLIVDAIDWLVDVWLKKEAACSSVP